MMKRLAWMSCAALVFGAAGSARAQESLQTVKDLYAQAAYEDALAAVNKLQSGGPTREIEQYRVFTLTALGRHEEAQKAMEAMVRADPSYSLDPVETPPRVHEAFVKVQQKMLPVVTKQLYTDARAALDRKDREQAVAQFDKLLKIIDGAGANAASMGDLRVLAEGFLDLSRALPGPTPGAGESPDTAKVAASTNAPITAPAPPAPTPVPSPASTAAARPSNTAANTTTGAGAPAASRSGAPAVARASIATPAGSPTDTRPFPLSQELPQWSPTDALSRRSAFSGAVTVKIGVDGRVDSAEMTKPVHPTYDPILLRTARSWRYQPATRNGQPVESELTVEVNLRPPQQ